MGTFAPVRNPCTLDMAVVECVLAMGNEREHLARWTRDG